ncbi:MAG: hypothetical protein RL026_1494, partial [Pseudomonadota bacterium]
MGRRSRVFLSGRLFTAVLLGGVVAVAQAAQPPDAVVRW